VARDAIWYPDAGIVYLVVRGQAKFTLVLVGWQPVPLDVKQNDLVFVPPAVQHTFENTSSGEADLEVVGFFNKSSPMPEVSLLASTNFLPRSLANASLVQWGNGTPRCPSSRPVDPLADLKPVHKSPYLIRVRKTDEKAGGKARPRKN
jgi:oxalate decarboxylase/phosphoglucose isomerase-like protein (cupin superfamily)